MIVYVILNIYFDLKLKKCLYIYLVLTIKNDSGCDIKHLGKLTNVTKGKISRVDVAKIGTEFSKVQSLYFVVYY